MGITGLIPFLEKASSKTHLKLLQGATVCVDTYCWLHKGVYSCADKLVRGEKTDHHIRYCLKYVDLLLSYDIKPILVFDGCHLPAKALTEQRRRESRKDAKRRAAELLRLGKVEEARSHMRRCVDVTHEMALQLIRECRERNVDCIVAPYEADAQMAWLNKTNVAQYVITEDSDLMLFGSKKVIFKLDLTGSGLLVESSKLHHAMGCSAEKFTFDKFLRMCILSGCDYLNSLPGIGLSKACKFILKTEEDDMRKALKKIPQYLNLRNLVVSEEYIEDFLKAEATFKHMYIYNPFKRRMERLHEIAAFQTDETHCSNAGVLLDSDELAFQLALGNLHPFSLKQLDNWHPDLYYENMMPKKTKSAKHISIWKIPHAEQLQVSQETHNQHRTGALYFKKIIFASHSIRGDTSVSITEDASKVDEEDIFAFYKTKEIPIKRKREHSIDTNNDTEEYEPTSPALSKTKYNPFAINSTEKQSSPPVLKHGSLLKMLSPGKRNNGNQFQLNNARAFKRSMLSLSAKVAENNVEVRSRFFAANQNVVDSKCSLPMMELANDIDRIEAKAKQAQDMQAQLCDSPSPVKKTISLDHTVKKLECDLGSVFSAEQKGNQQTDKDVVTMSPASKDVICISDESLDTCANLTELKSKPPVRALIGTSKPKSTTKTTSQAKKATRETRTTINQPLLSNFGFHRKPTLK